MSVPKHRVLSGVHTCLAGSLCLACRLQDIPGASVEHNNFCVSAHFRNCASENWQRVVLAVNDSVAAQPTQLHVTRGRKVLEVRPQVGCGLCLTCWGSSRLVHVAMSKCVPTAAGPHQQSSYVGSSRWQRSRVQHQQQLCARCRMQGHKGMPSCPAASCEQLT
jgi:hypothetical protein